MSPVAAALLVLLAHAIGLGSVIFLLHVARILPDDADADDSLYFYDPNQRD